jgi:hypothetical protein
LASFQLKQQTSDNPLIEKPLIEKPLNNTHKDWVLTVNMSLYNLHRSLLKTYTEKQLIQNGQYNEQLAVAYLIKNTHIYINKKENDAELQILNVNIGNHQSIFKFKLVHQSNDIKTFDFYIPAMNEHRHQMNMVKVIGSSWNIHIVLKDSNNYRGTIKPSNL